MEKRWGVELYVLQRRQSYRLKLLGASGGAGPAATIADVPGMVMETTKP